MVRDYNKSINSDEEYNKGVEHILLYVWHLFYLSKVICKAKFFVYDLKLLSDIILYR